MKNFDKKIRTLLEDMGDMGNTTSAAFGPGQAHAFQIGQSGDFYAPGDARNLFGSKKIINLLHLLSLNHQDLRRVRLSVEHQLACSK